MHQLVNVFRPRELSLNGKTQRFRSLDHLVINTDINLLTLGIQSLSA